MFRSRIGDAAQNKNSPKCFQNSCQDPRIGSRASPGHFQASETSSADNNRQNIAQSRDQPPLAAFSCTCLTIIQLMRVCLALGTCIAVRNRDIYLEASHFDKWRLRAGEQQCIPNMLLFLTISTKRKFPLRRNADSDSSCNS